MQINSNNMDFLVGDCGTIEKMQETPALRMFSDKAVGFLAALSTAIIRDKRSHEYADITSYAYWIRKASLENVKQKHTDKNERIGRGVAFHIAPSNVPVNFAVSMTSSLLAGNCTLIRVSDKKFPQVDIICDAINELLNGEHSCMKPYLCILRYSHSAEITQQLSSICDIRIIWGGDRTISEIRKASLPPRAIEMTFADRHSLAIINSDEYMNCDADKTAKDFYTDTYYTDQNACSSPRLVVWTGGSVNEAKQRFWSALGKLVKEQYDMKPIQAIDKYTSFCALGMKYGNIKLISDDNYVMRAEVSGLSADLMNYKNSGGYFFEYTASDISEIAPVLTKQCQTISVLGIDKDDIKKLVFDNGVRGVDRIVPLGQTMGLEFIWDGYKMIEAMTRFVYTGSY
ncbi:MAG: hypothetical protein IJZ95_09400 [Oscillospiraceae bacterium]|nr:hypothetical protein [Oscillospiraceae bacterium]